MPLEPAPSSPSFRLEPQPIELPGIETPTPLFLLTTLGLCALFLAEKGDFPNIVIREWRTRQDSNLWPLPSEGNALSS